MYASTLIYIVSNTSIYQSSKQLHLKRTIKYHSYLQFGVENIIELYSLWKNETKNQIGQVMMLQFLEKIILPSNSLCNNSFSHFARFYLCRIITFIHSFFFFFVLTNFMWEKNEKLAVLVVDKNCVVVDDIKDRKV